MHSEETVSQSGTCCQIVDIGSIGSRALGSRRMGRLDSLDKRFEKLDKGSRLLIVHAVIGYCRAMSDGIRDGRTSGTDEISRIVKAIEESINEAWKGGMI